DPVELFERGTAIDRDVGTSSRRERQVPTQDRRPPFRSDLLEVQGLTPPMAQHRSAPSGPHVAYPVRVLAEHRHEIALAFVVRDHHRERDDTAAAPSPNLQHPGTLRPDP